MSEKDVNFFSNSNVTKASIEQLTPVQANAYKAIVSSANYIQTGNTIRAFTEVGMTYKYIANALVSIGEQVETIKTSAAVATNITVDSGQVIEEANRIRGIQNRGEEITVTPRLNYPPPTSNTDLVTRVQVTNLNPEQKVSVVEGIEVSQRTPPISFVGPLTDRQLEEAKKPT